jgi:putative transposase
MIENNDIRHGRHCVFKMHVHLVFVAKYRRKVFDGDAIERLRRMFGRVCADFEATLAQMDTAKMTMCISWWNIRPRCLFLDG